MGKSWDGAVGKFGEWLKTNEVDREEMAKALKCTTSYVSMWAHGKAAPGRELAAHIEIWSGHKFGPKKAFRVVEWPRDKLACEKAAA